MWDEIYAVNEAISALNNFHITGPSIKQITACCRYIFLFVGVTFNLLLQKSVRVY